MPREHLRFTSDLQPNSCNIKFFPESGREPRERTINIVRQGRLQEGLDKFACVGFDLIKPCGISNDDLQMSCKGRYEIKDQNGDTALEVSLEMEPKTKIFDRKPGEQLSFTFDLEPSSCNIYFFPEGDSGPGKSIVGQGRLQLHSDEFDCVGFDLIKPCGISNDDLQMSCQGRYQIKDQNGDTAVEVTLEMEPLSYATSPIGISAGVFLSSLFCCCVRRCCRKSASKEDKSESEAPEPDVQYQVYDLEPVRLRPDHLSEPSGTHYPAQPPYTPTDPLIHNHPTVDVPPAYSEVSAPPVPVHSDSEPRYELKGMTFPSAPPLSSESTTCDVYTSAKFNFL
ncbi:uncharacterized protein LOC115014211 isoform X2 [Cottoperca gobio]|nr:uncharacterized protein LOC115014211 isoform X2 [Cottoperca gobio]